MTGTGPLAALRATYAASAFRKTENRVAGVVTVLVVLAVAGIARVPLGTALDLDLRAPTRSRGFVQASPLGFAGPSDDGRRLLAEHGRIVWNRPLPDRFELAIEARSTGPAEARVDLQVGATHHVVRFPPTRTERRFVVENPDGGRSLGLSTEDAGLVVSRVRVGPASP